MHKFLIKSVKISWVAQGTLNVVQFGNFIIQPFQIKIVNPKAKFHFYCFFYVEFSIKHGDVATFTKRSSNSNHTVNFFLGAVNEM